MSEILKVYELLNQLVSSSNISKEEFQSKALIRYSIVERILRVFFFKNNSKTPVDLYRILNFIKERHESEIGSDDIKDGLEKMKNLLGADQLCFYKKIIEEIITFPTKLKSNSNEFKEFTQENAVSEIENYLNKHIHINFFHMKSSSKKWDEKYFNESYIKHHLDKIHFEYSICSFSTMFKILKFFEYQGYTSKDPEALENCDKEVHGMISQKKLFNYLGFKGKEIDFIPTNLVSSFIDSHIKEITQELYNAESLVNNFEIENNICFSLFIINKIVKDYSFYFDKKPELEQIFLQLRKFKNWPIPVGNFGMHLYEIIINELYFQGVSLLNEMRKTFYIDILNPKLNSIETKLFTSAVFIYYYDDEKIEKVNEDGNKVDLNSILTYICKKPRKKDELSLREFMARLFITIIRNSKENINSSTFKNIMNFLLQKKSDGYTNHMMTIENEEEADVDVESNRRNFRSLEDNTKTCIDTLLKIITVGLDKSYDDFMEDVNMLVKPIIKISSNFNSFMQADISPITSFRSYLKPYYSDKRRINITQYVHGDDNPMTQIFNLYEIYKQNFWQMCHQNFSHLFEEASSDLNKLEEKRRNIYQDYRLKLVMIEDKKVLSSFIENLRNFYKTAIFQTKFNEDYEAIWSKFISKKEDFEIKYTLYVVPFEIDNMKSTSVPNSKEKNSDDLSYLISEYLSQHDHIYRYTIYIPWGLSKESELTSCMYKINEYNSTEDQFGPTQDTLYSYLHEPLNMYVRDSEHVFNLNLYKITIKNGEFPFERIFWKSVELSFGSNKSNEAKYKNNINNSNNKCNVTLECVDFLGVHHKEKDSNQNEKLVIPITPSGDYNLKIFNLFLRKDPPFCYNTTSNNGWLELYMSEKKLAQNSNFILSEFEYFKSVVIPQFELEAIYKNYKVTKLEIRPESSDVSFNIKIDDFPEFNSKELFSNNFMYNEITSVKIEEYIVNGNHMNVPIATFMPI